MNRILIIVFCLANALPAFAQPADNNEDWEKLLQSEAGRACVGDRGVANVHTLNYDVKYHRLEWQVSPEVRYISGVITTHFIPLTSGFNQIYFDLHSVMTVNSVSYHGTSCSFSQLGSHELLITFPSTLAAGVLDSVSVDYEGNPPTTGFGAYATQNVCTSVPAMWTLSEPYGARDWWPCKQDLNDKIDQIDVYITTPAAYDGVANGILMSETTSGSDKIYHWRHTHPIPAYLIAIAVSDYNIDADVLALSTGGLPMVNYLYTCNSTSAATINGITEPVMQLYIDKFGNYPYSDEKYGHAQFGWGGGMEHTTVSFMGGFSHMLIAHELAHQWFGDKITCGSWAHIWLNEGFATYLEGLTYENGLGPNTWANWKQSKINNVTSQAGGSVWVDDTTSVGRIFSSRLSYDKGALLLNMLRWKLGDTDFFQGIHNYINDPALAYHYAVTSDLQAHLEAVSGQDLDEFFADWFYGQGYPTYTISWTQNAMQQVTVQIFQAPSHASVPFFNIPVPVRFNGAGQNAILVFDPTVNGQVFTEQLNFSVTSVDFDPSRWLCAKSSVVLPIELLNFSAHWNGKFVQLNWETASEFDNTGFEIQRMNPFKNEASHWETLGWRDGQGTKTSPTRYEFEDINSLPGQNYYRLMQVDADGTEKYSTIVAIEVPDADRRLKVYPNPGNHEVWVEIPEGLEVAEVDIFDAYGRKVCTRHWNESLLRQTIRIDPLPSGIYRICLHSEGFEWQQSLLVR